MLTTTLIIICPPRGGKTTFTAALRESKLVVVDPGEFATDLRTIPDHIGRRFLLDARMSSAIENEHPDVVFFSSYRAALRILPDVPPAAVAFMLPSLRLMALRATKMSTGHVNAMFGAWRLVMDEYASLLERGVCPPAAYYDRDLPPSAVLRLVATWREREVSP